jgi:hypothetical protein
MNQTIEDRMQKIDDELKALREELKVELLPKYLSPEHQKRVLKSFMETIDDKEEEE